MSDLTKEDQRRAKRLLREAVTEMDDMRDGVAWECDHSVGLCYCSWFQTIELIEAFLKDIEGGGEVSDE